VEKIKRLKYIVLLLLSISITGCPLVNLYNNLLLNGQNFTAKLVCSTDGQEIILEAPTGEYSDCELVPNIKGTICECDFYANDEFEGTFIFPGCVNIRDYCPFPEGATFSFAIEGSSLYLGFTCVDKCGDPITATSDVIEREAILEFIPANEDAEQTYELYLDY